MPTNNLTTDCDNDDTVHTRKINHYSKGNGRTICTNKTVCIEIRLLTKSGARNAHSIWQWIWILHNSHATIRILALLETIESTLWHLQLFDTNKSIKSSSATTKIFFHLFLPSCVVCSKSNLLYYSRDRFDCNLSVPRIWTKQFVRFCFLFFLLVVFSVEVVISVCTPPFDPIRLLHRFLFFSFLYGISIKWIAKAKGTE